MCLLNSKGHFHLKIYRKITLQQQELAKTPECVLFTLVNIVKSNLFSKT